MVSIYDIFAEIDNFKNMGWNVWDEGRNFVF